MTDQTTRLLKASIELEKSKVFRLTNHSMESLSMVIDALHEQIKTLQGNINEHQRHIDNAEDMSERFKSELRALITSKRRVIGELINWRKLFLDAWTEVKNKK